MEGVQAIDVGQHTTVPSGYCGGAEEACAPWQNLAGIQSQQQQCQEHPLPEQLPHDQSQPSPKLGALQLLLQLLQPQLPHFLTVSLNQLYEQLGMRRQPQTRMEQLQEELRLTQMQHQLLLQAEEVLERQVEQKERTRRQQQQQQPPHIPAGTSCLLQQDEQSVGHPLPPQPAQIALDTASHQGPLAADWCASEMREVALAEKLWREQTSTSMLAYGLPGASGCGSAQRQGEQTCTLGREPGQQRDAGAKHPAIPMSIQGAAGAAESKSTVNTMKAHLQALRTEDPETVFVARRIHKLGFGSADLLLGYFSRYGEVKAVHVSYSQVKSSRSTTSCRMRAASLGFVVMASAEATARVLADGPEYRVCGVPIRVHTFHQHCCQLADEEPCSSGRRGDAEAGAAKETRNDAGQHLHAAGSAWAKRNDERPDPQSAVVSEVTGTTFGDGPLGCSLAGFSVKELYDALPEVYED
mmetsp:Transcript_97567/g.271435  ORF Transcript_97567/g.271435 Transcript_97567/m.271435 type:complete len:469 (+) Transcript_97567:114-1520(+)